MNLTNRENWCQWRVLCIFIILNWLHFLRRKLRTDGRLLQTDYQKQMYRCSFVLFLVCGVGGCVLCFPINYHTVIITITWGDLVNCKDKSIIILTHFLSLHQSKFTFPWSRKDILFFTFRIQNEWWWYIGWMNEIKNKSRIGCEMNANSSQCGISSAVRFINKSSQGFFCKNSLYFISSISNVISI